MSNNIFYTNLSHHYSIIFPVLFGDMLFTGVHILITGQYPYIWGFNGAILITFILLTALPIQLILIKIIPKEA